jgi:HAD superfamily hydrolase (TIGR01549 family)
MFNSTVKAVVLDLFDTLVQWSPSLLPLMEWKGYEIRTTAPWFLPKLAEALGDRFDRDRYLSAYFEVLGEINTERERSSLEISCFERFRRALTRFGLESDQASQLAADLTRVHMAGVRRVTIIPPERAETVRKIAPSYKLGIVSNFDDSETGHHIVADTGVAHLFDAVIISADIGLRKPHPLIFERIIELLGVGRDEILFVGDSPLYDVKGPHEAGMFTAWISNGRPPLGDDIPPPDLVLHDLTELPRALGC